MGNGSEFVFVFGSDVIDGRWREADGDVIVNVIDSGASFVAYREDGEGEDVARVLDAATFLKRFRPIEDDAPSESGPPGPAVPQHYDFAIQPDAAIEAWGLGFRLGNAVKYLARHRRKGDPVGDLRKAADYINREIAAMEREEAR